MKTESVFLHTSKAKETGLGIGPKAFYTVDMAMVIGKLILTVMLSVMLLIAKVYEYIVPAPSVRMDDASRVYSPTNDAL